MGTLLNIAGFAFCVYAGFHRHPAVVSIVIGAVIFTISYFLRRFGQISDLAREDKQKALTLPLYLLVPNLIIAAIFYGIAIGCAHFFGS